MKYIPTRKLSSFFSRSLLVLAAAGLGIAAAGCSQTDPVGDTTVATVVASTDAPTQLDVIQANGENCFAYYGLDELLDEADCIYRLEISAQEELPSDKEFHTITQYEAIVQEAFRGDDAQGETIRIQVETPIPQEGVAVSTADPDFSPKFEIGDEAVVFLIRQDSQEEPVYSVCGQRQGIYRAAGTQMVCDKPDRDSYVTEDFLRRLSQ